MVDISPLGRNRQTHFDYLALLVVRSCGHLLPKDSCTKDGRTQKLGAKTAVVQKLRKDAAQKLKLGVAQTLAQVDFLIVHSNLTELVRRRCWAGLELEVEYQFHSSECQVHLELVEVDHLALHSVVFWVSVVVVEIAALKKPQKTYRVAVEDLQVAAELAHYLVWSFLRCWDGRDGLQVWRLTVVTVLQVWRLTVVTVMLQQSSNPHLEHCLDSAGGWRSLVV